MTVTLALPPKDEIIPLEFTYADHDIEGWPSFGGFNVWVIDPEGEEYEVGRAEQPTEVRGIGVAWVDSPPGERFYVGATVRNGRSDNIYFVKAIKANGRLMLWYHGKPTIKNADPAKWSVVEVL